MLQRCLSRPLYLNICKRTQREEFFEEDSREERKGSINCSIYLVLMMKRINMRLGYKNQHGRVTFFYSILQVPLCAKRDIWKPRTTMFCKTVTAPDGARGCLNRRHKELIKNIWGQQRAILQSTGPTGECVIHLIKSIEGIWALLGKPGNGGVRGKWE